MQSIQIDGTYTYADNVKTLKLGQKIKLIPNPNNRLTKDAIGAYTLDGRKIGYIPYKANQVDIGANYTVTKISLTQNNPILLISRDYELSNFIEIELNPNKNTGIIKSSLDLELLNFSKFLKRNGNEIKKLGITFMNDYFINLLIETPAEVNIFYTVTKKFYEENVFKYEEFHKMGLMKHGIYQLFQIHRPEIYIQKNYLYFEKLIKKRKLNYDKLLDLNIINDDDNFGFQIIDSNEMKLDGNNIKCQILNHLSKNKYLYPVPKLTINLENLKNFLDIYNNLKVGGICYNHQFLTYSYIDLYDDINIVDISDDFYPSETNYLLYIVKLVIADKQIANIYDPTQGHVYRLEINDLIKNEIKKLVFETKKSKVI